MNWIEYSIFCATNQMIQAGGDQVDAALTIRDWIEYSIFCATNQMIQAGGDQVDAALTIREWNLQDNGGDDGSD